MSRCKKGTRSAALRNRFIFVKTFVAGFLVFLWLAVPSAKAENNPPEQSPASTSSQIKALEVRLAQIEANQLKILEKEEEIMKELHIIQVRVRRT
ncbi:MAG: hypothetical protein HYZ85_00600 [Candidatus Omnitrophica bacterium]|nr:hypothetical protein [Candidatus Omnitrophota bacterium]